MATKTKVPSTKSASTKALDKMAKLKEKRTPKPNAVKVELLALELPIERIALSGRNSRADLGDLSELADSIRANGILQPLVVRRMKDPDAYELIAGHRRLEAAKLAGLVVVPTVVRDADDATADQLRAVENLQRENLSELEQAADFERLKQTKTIGEIAAGVGKSKSYVFQRLQLLKLTGKAKERFAKGDFPAANAVEIARFDPATQDKIVNYWWCTGAVRELRKNIAKEITLPIDKAEFDPKDGTLVKAAGPCATCPFNSTNFKPEEGDEDFKPEEGRCLNRACWGEKIAAHRLRVQEALEKEHGKLTPISKEWYPPRENEMGREAAAQAQVFRNDFEEVKEGTKGAIPAVVVESQSWGENSTGTVTWIKLKDRKAQEQTQEEREAERQRFQQIRQRAQALKNDAVHKAILEMSPDQLLLAVCIEMVEEAYNTGWSEVAESLRLNVVTTSGDGDEEEEEAYVAACREAVIDYARRGPVNLIELANYAMNDWLTPESVFGEGNVPDFEALATAEIDGKKDDPKPPKGGKPKAGGDSGPEAPKEAPDNQTPEEAPGSQPDDPPALEIVEGGEAAPEDPANGQRLTASEDEDPTPTPVQTTAPMSPLEARGIRIVEIVRRAVTRSGEDKDRIRLVRSKDGFEAIQHWPSDPELEPKALEALLAEHLDEINNWAAPIEETANGQPQTANDPVPGVCRLCGCTQEEVTDLCLAVEPRGCSWAEPSLCSSCHKLQLAGLTAAQVADFAHRYETPDWKEGDDAILNAALDRIEPDGTVRPAPQTGAWFGAEAEGDHVMYRFAKVPGADLEHQLHLRFPNAPDPDYIHHFDLTEAEYEGGQTDAEPLIAQAVASLKEGASA